MGMGDESVLRCGQLFMNSPGPLTVARVKVGGGGQGCRRKGQFGARQSKSFWRGASF